MERLQYQNVMLGSIWEKIYRRHRGEWTEPSPLPDVIEVLCTKPKQGFETVSWNEWGKQEVVVVNVVKRVQGMWRLTLKCKWIGDGPKAWISCPSDLSVGECLTSLDSLNKTNLVLMSIPFGIDIRTSPQRYLFLGSTRYFGFLYDIRYNHTIFVICLILSKMRVNVRRRECEEELPWGRFPQQLQQWNTTLVISLWKQLCETLHKKHYFAYYHLNMTFSDHHS